MDSHQPKIDASKAFFIDETGSTVAMAWDHARAPRGERVSDHVPRNYGDVVTIIGALTVNGLTAMMTVRGGTTKGVFRAYTEQVLAPELRAGDLVASTTWRRTRTRRCVPSSKARAPR